LVVGSIGPLGDTHVVVLILKSLKPDEFPDDWRYSGLGLSSMSFIRVPAFSTMRGITSLIVKD
jgi:hypothetical protein